MGLFVGRHDNPIDKKGRVSIPAPFRAALGEPVKSIYVFPTVDPKRECIVVWSYAEMERLVEKMRRGFRGMSDQERRTAMLAVRAARQVTVDENGRMQIPADMAKALGIRDIATFVGDGLYCTIWAPARFDAEMDQLLSARFEGADDVLMGLISTDGDDAQRGPAMEGVDA